MSLFWESTRCSFSNSSSWFFPWGKLHQELKFLKEFVLGSIHIWNNSKNFFWVLPKSYFWTYFSSSPRIFPTSSYGNSWRFFPQVLQKFLLRFLHKCRLEFFYEFLLVFFQVIPLALCWSTSEIRPRISTWVSLGIPTEVSYIHEFVCGLLQELLPDSLQNRPTKFS